MKTIGIAGGTGFVGRQLAGLLTQQGYRVIVFSRTARPGNDRVRFAVWHPDRRKIDRQALSETDIMINLAGAGVTDHRWTAAYKEEILRSRVDATLFLLEELKANAPVCDRYLSASATGFYGPDREGTAPFTEDAAPYHDFLARVCRQWEDAALSAMDRFRTSVMRFGIVLGREGGAYPRLAGPMKFGIMPVLGSGRQMTSWIHVTDVARLILHLLESPGGAGIYNAVSPQPIAHRALMQTIAKAKGGLKIPAPAPAPLLRMILGESSTEVLKSCTVSAEKILSAGFTFRYPTVDEAVAALERQ